MVRIVPEEATLWGEGASQRFVVLAQGPDGLERDITGASEISVQDGTVARVDGSVVTAMATGQTIVHARVTGQQATARVTSAPHEKLRPFTFSEDIGRILTKRGCNSSDCHGGVKGRGGFKLSLDAIDPIDDYRWIIEGGGFQVLSPIALEPHLSRIDVQSPEESLLLSKPSRAVPHEGGRRLPDDSNDYAIVADWIRRGAPITEENAESVRVTSLEVFPREAVLEQDGEHQLLVTAQLSNGRREDITHQVRYESLREDIVRVDADGRVRARKLGATAILVRSVGHVASVDFRVIVEPTADYPEVERNNFIDEYVFAKLKRFHIRPSNLTDDGAFLRRVCLDITGALPPPDRVREFLSNPDPQKRSRLIDVLLNSPEYDEYWTFLFSDLFRVRGHYGWLHMFWEWVRSRVAANTPYDQIARELIAAQGFNGPTRHHLLDLNKPRPIERTVTESFRVFMGRRLDCAQCHNHPFDRWSQDQFWGLAAFFGRLTNTRWYAGNVVFDDVNGHESNLGSLGEGLIFRPRLHPRTKEPILPTFPDGQVLPPKDRVDPRRHLAEWMTSHPYFAETTVNRIWGHFFGRGIVEPVDDFRVDNPPTHPELLAHLAEDFRQSSYNLKALIRRIANSRTYQLSSVPNESNRHDTTDYSHAQPRPLLAEVLLDAIVSATGVQELFEPRGALMLGAAPRGSRAVNLKYPAEYASKFLEVYDRPLRKSLPERRGESNLSQALHILVGDTYTEKLAKEGGRIDSFLENDGTNGVLIDELYLAALTRLPTPEERAGLESFITEHEDRREAIADLLWALISSREFAENH